MNATEKKIMGGRKRDRKGMGTVVEYGQGRSEEMRE